MARFQLFFGWWGIYCTEYDQNVNYSDWLGSDYDTASEEKASMIVSNHMGWYEIIAIIAGPLFPGFTPRADKQNVPLLNNVI
jgi:hypothetical protein